MKRSCLFILLLLTGCSGNTENVNGYSEDEVQIAIDEAYEEGRQAGYDEGHLAGYDEGQSEGYTQGYDEGYEMGNKEGYAYGMSVGLDEDTQSLPAFSNTPSSGYSSGLNLNSDGMDWDIALDYEKKEFVRAVAESNGEFITYSEVDDYVLAIDIYYESNMRLKTLNEALKAIK